MTAVDELAQAGRARRQLWRHTDTQSHAQGLVGSRHPIEWGGVDGTLAIRVVSAGSGATQSDGGKRARAGRAGWLSTAFTDEQIKTLATIPILAVFGDHRDTPTGIGIRPSWQLSFESCQALIARLKAAGGQARCSTRRDRGIRGNSHMIMQDKNNLQIADLILRWIDERVSKRTAATR